MSLPNPKQYVTEERLNEYHNIILPYLGGMPDILANKFARGDMYSTDEKIIGQWIDGKPLYQKVIEFAIAKDGWNHYAHNIANIDKCISINCFALYTDEAYTVGWKTNGSYIEGYFGKSNVSVDSKSYSGYTARCIIQYTKTTDSSVEIGLDTDYSTTEKIVGTWIDGKPIYQKTFLTPSALNLTNLSSWNNTGITTDIPIDLVINAFAIRSSSNSNILLSATNANGQIKVIPMYADDLPVNSPITIQYTKTTD